MCNVNATVVAVEYERCYPNLRITDSKQLVGHSKNIYTSYKCSLQHHAEIKVHAVQHSSGISTPCLLRRVGVSHSMVWRTFNQNKFYYNWAEIKPNSMVEQLSTHIYCERVVWLNSQSANQIFIFLVSLISKVYLQFLQEEFPWLLQEVPLLLRY